MNYNTIAYLIFIPTVIIVTVRVGYQCFTYGKEFLNCAFVKEPHLVDPINNSLLVGYIVLNTGYALVSLKFWETITNLSHLIEYLSFQLGCLILLLGVMHVFNMSVTYIISKRKIINQQNHINYGN